MKCLLARGKTNAKETLEGQAQAQGSSWNLQIDDANAIENSLRQKLEPGSSVGIVVTGLTVLLWVECGLGDFGLGNPLKEGRKVGLVDHTRRSVEDSGAESNVDHVVPDQEVLEEKNIAHLCSSICRHVFHGLP
ncbi:hypothetical protein STEG23_006034, partial [Scotinomys teguina]